MIIGHINSGLRLKISTQARTGLEIGEISECS